MRLKIKFLYLPFFLLLFSNASMSQSSDTLNRDGKLQINFNEEGTNYVRLTGLIQTWLRHTDLNPGTTINNSPESSLNDIGIRRLRFLIYGQLTDNVFFFTQFGQNNFSTRSVKYAGAFFHDAIGEIRVYRKNISIGGGLTGWSGLLRYASPSIGTLMTMDAPLYQQATHSISDQFLRKLSVYAKGQIGKLDYRLALTDPLDVQTGPAGTSILDSTVASFNPNPPSFQYQVYMKYQFFENESNLTPYPTGTYMGEKKVLALGAGIITQPDAIWKLNSQGDTTLQPLTMIGADVFFESPLNDDHSMSFTFYGAYSMYDFGDNYIRNTGVMNPGNGINANGSLNGTGNGFPMIGTGNTIYFQTGLAFGKNIVCDGGKLQPYIASQISDYEALDELMIMGEAGMNWYIHGRHNSKLTINYQSRPVFEPNSNGENVVTSRKGMAQVQLQVSF